MNLAVRRLSLCCLVLMLGWAPIASAAKTDAQFRGPGSDQAMAAVDIPGGDFGLRVSWQRELGSGYSNIWIAGDRGVTMFTSGDVDVVAAFDVDSGKEQWRYELGPKYAGHDGSTDGPLGTPTVADGVVYALGPHGQLVALDFKDGSEKWRRELTEENSTVPPYGFTSSPIVTGKLVLVATGGEGHAVTAFDRASGETRWSSGDDTVSYQTPMLMELGGRRQLVAVTDFFLQGLDPADGEVLWQLRHTEGAQPDRSAHPTAVGDDTFLVKYGRGARLYRYADGAVEEVWQTRAFGNTFALPELVDGHLYGFTGAVMTCVDAATGEIVWRARDVSGRGLAALGGTLAVFALNGDLVLVDPSPEGYDEVARVPVLDNGDYAVPSYGAGQIVVRNLERIAAVTIDDSMTPQMARLDDSIRLLGDFGEWVAATEALAVGRRQAAVDERFDDGASGPLFDDDGVAHLIWRGQADDVAVRGTMATAQGELPLFRLEGTDLFYRSFELDPKANYTYNMIFDFGPPATDPGNPHTVDNGFGVVSELRMPDWPSAPHLEPPADDAPRGQLDRFQFHSEILANTREIQVWRPADYGQDPERRYPVLVVNHGDNLLRGGLMHNTLDNLVGETVAPLIAVFVPRVAPPEYGGPLAADYARFLVDELLPHVDRHYRTDGESRAIMGPGSAGVAAAYTALSYPDVFRKAAVQSFYPIEPVQAELPELIEDASPKPEMFYVVWSHNDYDLGDGRRADDASRELLAQLRAADVNVVEQISNYSPGWGGWRGQDDEILEAFFPLEAAGD